MNMIMHGCSCSSLTSSGIGIVQLFPYKAKSCSPGRSYNVTSFRPPCLPKKALSLRSGSLRTPPKHLETKISPLSAASLASASFFGGELSSLSRSIPSLMKRRRSFQSPKAANDVPSFYRYHPMEKKPMWWWRILACLPYLMPFHGRFMYAESAYHLYPFLENFEFLTYPFWGAVEKLPDWLIMVYFYVAYVRVVRRKEWPHFFRFHVIMGMLLSIAKQVIDTVSFRVPLAWQCGKEGAYVLAALAFAYLFTVMKCIMCALAGMYADVPFVSDAAYIHSNSV